MSSWSPFAYCSSTSQVNSEWLSKDITALTECTLGLQWNCQTDRLGYRGQATETSTTTMNKTYQAFLDASVQLKHSPDANVTPTAADYQAEIEILFAPKHLLSKLLIQDYDEMLKYCGPERVFAELRRRFWMEKGERQYGSTSVVVFSANGGVQSQLYPGWHIFQ